MEENKVEEVEIINEEVCPVCGEQIIVVSRCKTCTNCDWGTCMI